MELLHQETTGQVIGAAFEVWRTLGYGYLEKVYRRSMGVELSLRGVAAEHEKRICVYYKESLVGDFVADLWVNDCVLVELKVAEHYRTADEAQLLNELHATDTKVGLLINFGREKVEFKRLVN